MPAETVLLGTRPLELAAVARSAGPDVEVVPVAGGGAVQLHVAGRLLLTLVQPRRVAARAEVERLLPDLRPPDAGPIWWTTVVVAPDADLPRAERLLAALRDAAR